MSLLDINNTEFPKAVKSFQAEISSVDNNIKTLKYKYEPLVTIKHIRQSCKVKKINANQIKKCKEYQEEYKGMLDLSDSEDESTLPTVTSRHNKRKKLNDDCSYTVSPNGKTLLTFEFKNHPEFITLGSHIIINDSSLRAYGVVTKIN